MELYPNVDMWLLFFAITASEPPKEAGKNVCKKKVGKASTSTQESTLKGSSTAQKPRRKLYITDLETQKSLKILIIKFSVNKNLKCLSKLANFGKKLPCNTAFPEERQKERWHTATQWGTKATGVLSTFREHIQRVM